MSVDPYTGSAADINRIRAIEREREEKKKNFEQRKADLKSDSSSGLKKIGSLSLLHALHFSGATHRVYHSRVHYYYLLGTPLLSNSPAVL